MTSKESIENWLSRCSLTASDGCAPGTGLRDIYQKAFGHRKNVLKAAAVRDLAEFYSHNKNITQIWTGSADGLFPTEGLCDVEKAFVAAVVRSDGEEFKPGMKKMADDYKLSYTPRSGHADYPWLNNDIFNPDYHYGCFHLAFLHLLKQHYPTSRVSMLFPGGYYMPDFILSALRPLIPPIELKLHNYSPAAEDRIICRENRLADFASLVRFAGSVELKPRSCTWDITKAKLAKLVNEANLEEVCDVNGKFGTPKEASYILDFKVALPLFLLSVNSGLLALDKKGCIRPARRASSLLKSKPHELAKKIFDDYMEDNNIYEGRYITGISMGNTETFINWSLCRQPIVELLKSCPVNVWVNYGDFEHHFSLVSVFFLRKLLRGVLFIHSSDNFERRAPNWEECESQFIRLILSFLGAIGILDIAYTENVLFSKQIEDEYCVGISGFRITALGAWILGLAEQYEAESTGALQSAEGELLVQPDYSVVLTGLQTMIEHEPFLSSFLTKTSTDKNVAIYRIDFTSIVRAYNMEDRLTPEQILDYLRKASVRPIPENVERSLIDWQHKVGRVKICRATLLEADDELLLQELIHEKGADKHILGKISYAVELKSAVDAAKIKTIAEKNGWLVDSKL